MRLLLVLFVLMVTSAAAAVVVASCSQTPTNVPVRTFELAQKVDVVCMQVFDESGEPLAAPIPVTEDNCSPVPLNCSNAACSGVVDGGALANHLYAAVTQVARGELAVVDLTAGVVVDEDRSTPGINFIPVGAIPTDVAIAPDAQMTYVSSRDPNKPAIYAMPSNRLLGDSMNAPPGGYGAAGAPSPLTLTDLYACALPQPPLALTIASLPSGKYVLLAMLGEFGGESAKIAALDPTPLINGVDGNDGGVAAGSLTPCSVLGAIALGTPAPSTSWSPGPVWPDGVPYVDGGVVLADAEPSPGPSCSASPAADAGGPTPLAVGALGQPEPNAMVMRTDVPLLYVSDSALPLIHVIDVSDPTAPKEQLPLLATSVNQPTRLVAVGALAISPPTHDYKRYLYAVDSAQGSVMVFDVTDPVSSPRTPLERPHPELNPFSAPDRLQFSAPAATLAFVQHDWPLPAQVYQGSAPVQQYTGLLCDPNPYAHPNATTFLDRGAYYRADQDSVIQVNTSGYYGSVENFPYRLRGIFGFVTLTNGVIVVLDVDDWDSPCRRPDPMSNNPNLADPFDKGIPYSGATDGLGMTGLLDVPEPDAGSPTDLDPYHAPITYTEAITESAATTLEAFFPVSAPHRIRSNFLLRNDPTSGLHIPNELGAALLFDVNGSLVATNVTGGSSASLMLPTPLPPNFYDPTYLQNPTEPDPAGRLAVSASLQPLLSSTAQTQNSQQQPTSWNVLMPGTNQTSPPGVRVSFDDPTAQQDQDWQVTYEGALPSVANIALEMYSDDGSYETLTMSTGVQGADGGAPATSAATSPGLCGRGIEDWSIGQARATQILSALTAAGLPAPGQGANGSPTLKQWTSDYVEIVDDLLPPGDPYWATPSGPDQDCWDGSLADPDGTAYPSPQASARYDYCAEQYGWDGEDAAPEGNQTIADTYLLRDFPILEAYDDHLVLGRFGWVPTDPSNNPVGEQTNNRVVVGPDPSNAPFTRLARCCFHHQATFKVRTGGEWLTVGSATGLLHHVQADPATNRCVLSCNPTYALENARTFDIPWSTPASAGSSAAGCLPPPGLPPGLDRNSVLAMRNPMFSFVMWQGCTPLVGNDHTETARDNVWKFSMRGGFQPVTVSISQNTSTAVLPQSMRFIDSLGQLAVVDGASQGLVLIDLNTLQFAHSPYY
ncbi:MAG: hypothetical protein ABSE49_11415 [Polyangiaceae bacterium]